jgi:flagellum-specific peptidoglycan hydrolase FlgJ
MPSYQSEDYQPRDQRIRQGRLFDEKRHMQKNHYYTPLPPITFSFLLRKLLQGLRKIWVAIYYRFDRHVSSLLGRLRLPWYRIGLIALAAFILTQKDLQFSLNMRAPLTGATHGDQQGRAVRTHTSEEMGLAQPLALKNNSALSFKAASLNDLDEDRAKAYIKRFSKVAVAEMEKFGIPASINMAQAIVESWAGSHPAVRQNNNHFGAPLSDQLFESAWENWRAHSQLLRNAYPALLQTGNSYKKWARALQKARYNKDRSYDDKLIDVIEKYQLYLLDEY